MGKELAKTTKVPQHLAVLGGVNTEADDWGSGQVGGFPVISLKGKVFHIRRGDELELVTRPDEPDEPASALRVIILKTHKGTAKTYYAGTYVEGSDDKPSCYSADGIVPAADAESRQFKNCALCPRNQWGSRVTEDGKKAKECSDVKRLAVADPNQPNEPMLLRVPPTSLKAWDQYVRRLQKRGVTPTHLVTKISFDPGVAHQSLLFKEVSFVTAEQVPDIEEALADPITEAIIGSDQGYSASAADAPDAEPGPEKKAPPKRKPRTRKVVEEVAEPELDDDDLDFDEEPAEEKKAPAKRKPRTKKAAEEEPELDFDDDEPEAEKKVPAKRKPRTKKAVVVEEEPAAEDGEFDDLDFDDLDFGDD